MIRSLGWAVVGVSGMVLLGSLVAISPVAAGSGGCVASGTSDGVTAEAVAACETPPDGLVLVPLACQLVSYHLVVSDDTKTAVFPDRVVENHSLSAAPPENGHGAEGFSNNFGTVADVLGDGVVPLVGSEVYPEYGDRRFSATGRWWARTCWEEMPGSQRLEPSATDGPFPEGPEVPLKELIARARAWVDPPPVPPVVHAGPASVTQLPSWFWVEEDWWSLPHYHRTNHGLISVAVAAVPTRWNLSAVETGNTLLECEGAGEPWEKGAPDASACTYTFAQRADGQVRIRLTVELGVSWTSSVNSYGTQSLNPIFRTTVSGHPLIEIVGLRSD